ncbi:MAG: hypothetical protein OEW29_05795, partial [Acidimicrobiia bacterium]|nr:hypothetical protein [Acidimicrobiia bacterium]
MAPTGGTGSLNAGTGPHTGSGGWATVNVRSTAEARRDVGHGGRHRLGTGGGHGSPPVLVPSRHHEGQAGWGQLAVVAPGVGGGAGHVHRLGG